MPAAAAGSAMPSRPRRASPSPSPAAPKKPTSKYGWISLWGLVDYRLCAPQQPRPHPSSALLPAHARAAGGAAGGSRPTRRRRGPRRASCATPWSGRSSSAAGACPAGTCCSATWGTSPVRRRPPLPPATQAEARLARPPALPPVRCVGACSGTNPQLSTAAQ